MLTNVNGTLQYRLLEDREAAKLLGPGAKWSRGIVQTWIRHVSSQDWLTCYLLDHYCKYPSFYEIIHYPITVACLQAL
jgi:hypothetical protein